MIRVELNPVDRMYEIYWGNGGRTLYGVASTLEDVNEIVNELEGRDNGTVDSYSGRRPSQSRREDG